MNIQCHYNLCTANFGPHYSIAISVLSQWKAFAINQSTLKLFASADTSEFLLFALCII